jgi:hypothetical protein
MEERYEIVSERARSRAGILARARQGNSDGGGGGGGGGDGGMGHGQGYAQENGGEEGDSGSGLAGSGSGSKLDGLEMKDLSIPQRRKVAMLRNKRERLEKELEKLSSGVVM